MGGAASGPEANGSERRSPEPPGKRQGGRAEGEVRSPPSHGAVRPFVLQGIPLPEGFPRGANWPRLGSGVVNAAGGAPRLVLRLRERDELLRVPRHRVEAPARPLLLGLLDPLQPGGDEVPPDRSVVDPCNNKF